MATIFFSHFIKFFTHEHPLRTGGGSKVTPGRFSAKIGPARKKFFRQNLRLKKLGIYMEGQRHTVKRKKNGIIKTALSRDCVSIKTLWRRWGSIKP